MEIGLGLLLALGAILLVVPRDPAPGMGLSRETLRRLDCTWTDPERGSQLYPGRIVTPAPRGDFTERETVICRERLLAAGLRPARDEAILSGLEARASGLATAAAARHTELAGATWLVEVFYPSAPVSPKVAFATKNALMQQGVAVSDRVPRLGVGDIDVITRLPPEAAYPAACWRYHANGSLGADDVLLAVVSRDLRETDLHAGLCVQGNWAWLQ